MHVWKLRETVLISLKRLPAKNYLLGIWVGGVKDMDTATLNEMVKQLNGIKKELKIDRCLYGRQVRKNRLCGVVSVQADAMDLDAVGAMARASGVVRIYV